MSDLSDPTKDSDVPSRGATFAVRVGLLVASWIVAFLCVRGAWCLVQDLLGR